MVAATTPRLEFVPPVNLARLFLFRAAEALDAGRVYEAGILLREAVRRQLFAECAWKGCLPPKQRTWRSPTALLDALHKAGHAGYCGYEWTKEIIDIGNACAHCAKADPREIRALIAVWHTAIDNDPCGEPTERAAYWKPAAEASGGCDDDDSADWWKAGSQ